MNILRYLTIHFEKTPIVFPEDGRPGTRYQIHMGWWPWIIASYMVYRFIRRELRAA